MLNLREYRNKPDRLSDYLPWAALIAPGVVLNKDGSFQKTFRFRGPDLDSATKAELVSTTARINNVLKRLTSGWAIYAEAQRVKSQEYPSSVFPDPVTAMIDDERKNSFAAAIITRAIFISPLYIYRHQKVPISWKSILSGGI